MAFGPQPRVPRASGGCGSAHGFPVMQRAPDSRHAQPDHVPAHCADADRRHEHVGELINPGGQF